MSFIHCLSISTDRERERERVTKGTERRRQLNILGELSLEKRRNKGKKKIKEIYINRLSPAVFTQTANPIDLKD